MPSNQPITLAQFESIGEDYARQLRAIGIDSVDEFLAHAVDEIHQRTQIDATRVSQWRDVLDLFRVPKVSARDAELLVAANVNSVAELSHRQAVRIYYKLKEIDEASYLIITQLPTFRQIDEWIDFAKLLTKRVKRGLNVPLVKLPGITIDVASRFQLYQIWTVDDLVAKQALVPKLHKKVGLSKEAYATLLQLVTLLEIDGVDAYFATLLHAAGIHSREALVQQPATDTLAKLQALQQQERPGEQAGEGPQPQAREPITIEHLKAWQAFAANLDVAKAANAARAATTSTVASVPPAGEVESETEHQSKHQPTNSGEASA